METGNVFLEGWRKGDRGFQGGLHGTDTGDAKVSRTPRPTSRGCRLEVGAIKEGASLPGL